MLSVTRFNPKTLVGLCLKAYQNPHPALSHNWRLSINAFGVRRPCRYRCAKSLSDALSLTRERVRVWVASRCKYYASHRHRRTIASRRYAYDRLHPHPPRDLQEQITRRPLPVCACGHVRRRGRGYFSTVSKCGRAEKRAFSHIGMSEREHQGALRQRDVGEGQKGALA